MTHNKKVPFFSVIVPIYKVEKYLTECIESICGQSFDDFEMILVDDGSPDRCPQICDEYSRKDLRIQVIHKKNGGLVEARKTGITAARGSYAVFIDGDDWIDKHLLMTTKEILDDHTADMVVFDYFRNTLNTETVCRFHVAPGYYTGEKKEQELCAKMMCTGKYYQFGVAPSIATKVFKTTLIREMLQKVDGRITMGEDAAVTYPAMIKADAVVISSKAFYHYREVQDSMSLEYNPKYFEKIEILMDWFDYQQIHFLDEQLKLYNLMLLEEGILRALTHGNSLLQAVKEVKYICQKERYRRLLDQVTMDVVNNEKKKMIQMLKNNQYAKMYMMFGIIRIKRKIKKIMRR